MRSFQVSAEFKLGNHMARMNKEILAENKEKAIDKVLCILGSKHRTPRRFINILSIAESTNASVILDGNEQKK